MKAMDRERWGMLVKELQGGTEFATLSEDQLMKAVEEEELSLNLDSLGNNQHSATSNFYIGMEKLKAQDLTGAEKYLALAIQPTNAEGEVRLTKRQTYEATIQFIRAKLDQKKPVSNFIPMIERQMIEMEPSSKIEYDDLYYLTLMQLGQLNELRGNRDQAIRYAQKRVQYAMEMSQDAALVIDSLDALGRLYANNGQIRDAISAMRNGYSTLQSSGRTAGLAENDPAVVAFKYNLARHYLELAHREGIAESRKQGIVLLKELEKLDLTSLKQDRGKEAIPEDVRSILKKELGRHKGTSR